MRTKSGKKVSFDPRAGNKYRVLLDGEPFPGREGLLTKEQILNGAYEQLARGQSFTIAPASNPRKAAKTNHPSRYRAKHR